MLRVLVVSPRFAPSNAPDMHRIRLLLGYANQSGWHAEVLAIEPEDLPVPRDPWLALRLSETVPIHRVRVGRTLVRFGIRALWLRSFWALLRKGATLLSQKQFDLVFFSTTEFPLHVLGPLWKRRFGVPFCMDLQDPWVNDYYRDHPKVTPPGGRLKYAIAAQIDRVLERFVITRCAGFLTVSERYLLDLERRYGARAATQPRLIKPFPGEPNEHVEFISRRIVGGNARPVWRYIGRGGEDMRFALRAFLAAWKRARVASEAPPKLLFEAIGTSYAPAGAGTPSLQPETAAFGLDSEFIERTDRVAYSEALTLMQNSDALVVFGSDDPAYTASKIYPYLLSRRPVLAIFHEKSSVVSLMREVGGGVCLTYNEQTTLDMLAEKIYQVWFCQGGWRVAVEMDLGKFAPYTAREQALAIGTWFRTILATRAPRYA